MIDHAVESNPNLYPVPESMLSQLRLSSEMLIAKVVKLDKFYQTHLPRLVLYALDSIYRGLKIWLSSAEESPKPTLQTYRIPEKTGLNLPSTDKTL